MWKQILYLSWLVAAGCSDIADREYPEPQPAPAATTDSQATVQTRNLLGNLRSIAENGGTLFGHQCSSLYGIGWSGDVDRSDVKSICGDYPAMMGWDLAQIELWDLDPNSPTGVDNDAKNIDGDKFTDIRNRILEAYARGGVTTIGWHTTNPATGGTAWDVTAAVGRIIPGGDLHEKYCGWLDKVAAFMNTPATVSGGVRATAPQKSISPCGVLRSNTCAIRRACITCCMSTRPISSVRRTIISNSGRAMPMSTYSVWMPMTAVPGPSRPTACD